MRVLLTRSVEDNEPLAGAVRAEGWEPVLAPLVERRWDRAAMAAAAQGRFDVLLLTSAAAVPAVPVDLEVDRIAAVGPRTAFAARAAGLEPDVVGDGTGADLVRGLDLAGRRVLYPRARMADGATSDALRAAGAAVVDVAAYDNVAPDGWRATLTAALPVDVVALFSGSAARRLAIVGVGDARVVVIGPTTRDAAERAGLAVAAMADPHTAEGVIAAIRALP